MDIKFSIITVCKNEEKYIEKTIQSVINQTYKNIEFIIVDGHSTDRTLEIIEKYKNNIDTLIFDDGKGIYAAMNRGIQAASGDFLCFMNANDCIYDNKVLEYVKTLIENHKDVEMVLGQGIYENGRLYYSTDYEKVKNKYDMFERPYFCHQSIYYRKDVFKKYGLYSEKLKLASDSVLNFDFVFNKQCKIVRTNKLLSSLTSGGLSFVSPDSEKELKIHINTYYPYMFMKLLCLLKYFCPKLYLLIYSLMSKFNKQKASFNFAEKI